MFSFRSSVYMTSERSSRDSDIVSEDATDESLKPDKLPESATDALSCISDHVLRFATKYYANHQLPRSHVQEVMTDVRDLFEEVLGVMKPSICRTLGLPCNTLDKMGCLSNFLKPFSNLSTEHLRFKALKDSGHLVSITDYIIGDRVDDKLSDGIMMKEIVSVHARFIPMRVVLQKLFSLPGVLSSVQSYISDLEGETDIIENFIQCELWRNKVQKYFADKLVIPLFLYFDDFEVNNPLGSHTGIQKLGALYYSIACFPPQVNSLLENIFMAALFHSSDRVVFKNHRVFDKVIEEINFLQSEGILVETENGPQRIFFALGLILGDNLGLNSVLGFVESFNAGYYCRLCKIHKEVAQFDFHESRLRRHTYAEDVLLGDMSLTGIKERSAWNDVQYFSTETNFSVDWLHDGPEGWFAHVMGLIVHYFTREILPVENRLSMNVLNSRLNSFEYRRNGLSNKPPDVAAQEIVNKTFKMSGSEMLNFIYIFSMLVGDLVPSDDKVWKLYLLMRQIMDIVTCRKLQKGYANLLKTLVVEHLMLFKETFPDERVRPKGHNFVHYATVLEQSGPLINLSTIRFEAKHKDKKRQATATTSRKNITKTLCIKEQLGVAYRFLLKKGLSTCEDFGGEECLEDIKM